MFGFCVFLRRKSKSEEVTLSSLSRLYILANLLGNESPWSVISDWWISIRFVCFCVSGLIALFLKSTVSFTLVLIFFNFFILKLNVASLNFKGEIVPIELPNPEETQIRKGENELVRSH